MDKEQTIASSPRRWGRVDAVKGIAILLMAYGHVVQGGMHRHIWDATSSWKYWLSFVNAFIYSFHMPAFFFAAGLFLVDSVTKRGGLGFTIEKLKTILYPYVLWVILGFISLPFTAKYMARTAVFSWRNLFDALWTGNASWFLITLFVCQMLALALMRFPYWVQMAIALAASLLVPNSGITVIFAPFLYLPFVVAGMWFSAKRLPMLDRVEKGTGCIALAVLLPIHLILIRLWGPVTRWDRFLIGLLGITILFLLCAVIRNTIVDRCLQWYGEGSLAIFLISPYSQGISREIVTRTLRITHPVPYLLLISLGSATVPVLIWAWQKRLHITWLFRWPRIRKEGEVIPVQTVTN